MIRSATARLRSRDRLAPGPTAVAIPRAVRTRIPGAVTLRGRRRNKEAVGIGHQTLPRPEDWLPCDAAIVLSIKLSGDVLWEAIDARATVLSH